MKKKLRKAKVAETNGKLDGETIVSKLDADDLREFNSRQELMHREYQLFQAAGAYVDAFNREIAAKYSLPGNFSVKTETGIITVPNVEALPVAEEVTQDG